MNCLMHLYHSSDNFRVYGPKPLSDNFLSLFISYDKTLVYACNQNYLVTYGSYTGDLNAPSFLSKYHFFSRQTTKIITKSLPKSLMQVTMILDGNHLIIHGKMDFDSPFITLKGNLSEDTVRFVKIATMPVTNNSGFKQTICMHNQQLYAIESYHSYSNLYVFKLNLINKQWKTLCRGDCISISTSVPYVSQRAVSHNNKLYLINDKTTEKSGEHNYYTLWHIEEFNLQTKQWIHFDCPVPKGIISRFLNNPIKILHNGWMQSPTQTQFLYMSANHNDDGNGNWILYDIWRLDLITFNWKCISLEIPKTFHPKTNLPINHYAFYQYNSRAIDYIKPNTIPSLLSLAWDATCDLYLDTLSEMSVAELCRMGIPENYINKIKGLRFA